MCLNLKKKGFTSFDLAAVVHELKESILDYRVSNVYQLDYKTLLFKLHKPQKQPLQLIIEAGKRLHLTVYRFDKPKIPPAFCMALRKNLRYSRLTNIRQQEFDRVAIFSFQTKFGKMQLILELFGDGNIILVDNEKRILQALSYKRMRDRNILRGEAFLFAPPSGKNPVNIIKEEIIEEFKKNGTNEAVKVLTRFLSIGGDYAEEILLRSGIDKEKVCNALKESEVITIFSNLKNLISKVINGKLEASIVLDSNGEYMAVMPVKLKRFDGYELKGYSNFSEALDEFYSKSSVVEKAVTSINAEAFQREVEKLKRIMAEQEIMLTEAKEAIEMNRRIGDLIYTHSGSLQSLLDKFIIGKRNGKNFCEIVSEVLTEQKERENNVFDFFDSKKLIINVYLDDVHFGLDLRKNLFKNAAWFYEQSKKAKRKFEGAAAALEDSRKKLEKAKVKRKEAEILKKTLPVEALKEAAKRKIRPKKWFEKYRWFISSDDKLVVAGKDATSNEVLVKKYTEPTDIVLHAEVSGAPFVVIKTGGEEPSKQCLYEAGEFAASFSRGWREGFGSVDVYWVKPEQLSKSAPSGEYIKHGAFRVSGKRNWQKGVTLKQAIGVIAEKGEVKFIGGPLEAVKAQTNKYLVIVPGELRSKKLYKTILNTLAKKMGKEIQKKVLNASIEDIREYIPFSRGTLKE
jgi:predicted ribosome quality control (RQC) complex YloA/Tae2 family protein